MKWLIFVNLLLYNISARKQSNVRVCVAEVQCRQASLVQLQEELERQRAQMEQMEQDKDSQLMSLKEELLSQTQQLDSCQARVSTTAAGQKYLHAHMTLHVSYIIDAASIMNELCRFLQSFKCFFCSYCFIQHYPQVSKSLIFHVLLIIDLEIKLKTSLSFVHFHWFRCFTGNTCIYCLFVSPSVLLLSGLYPDFIISYYLFLLQFVQRDTFQLMPQFKCD